MKKTLLCIDGDEIVYKAGFASQYPRYDIVDSHGNVISSHAERSDAIESLGTTEDDSIEIVKELIPRGEQTARFSAYAVMNTILADTNPDDYRIYLTGEGNFRYDIATLLPYKGNRAEGSRPIYYEFVKQLLIDEFGAKIINGMEADDALSITQWYHLLNDTSWTTIIATQDKDLRMVPGKHYNPRTRELFEVDWIEARFNFYCQLLTGDLSVDNIPGIYRVGRKTAEKMLASKKNGTNKELYDVVFKAYIDAQKNERIRDKMPGTKFGEDRIKEVGRLLWMLQEKHQLWTPGVDYYAGCQKA